MNTRWVIAASVLGLLAVGAGAFGAHGLKGILEPDQLSSYEVAVRYQMYHALAMLAAAWMCEQRPSRWATASCWCFLVGVVLFSGSIYGLVFTPWRWLIPLTPTGGFLMMCGWFSLAIASRKSRA
ncbi:MAG: DUF423 domain-containing protein [Planctomycetota bacterium]|jgi:uncharacterized membrane protein YgdD (TMEM256/DUF423 family)